MSGVHNTHRLGNPVSTCGMGVAWSSSSFKDIPHCSRTSRDQLIVFLFAVSVHRKKRRWNGLLVVIFEFHNHAVNPARPPAQQTMESLFDKTAGLKRFHSHSHQVHTFLHNVGWEGGLSKITRSVALDQNSNNRNCTRDRDPPTHQNNASLCVSHLCALFVTTIMQ